MLDHSDGHEQQILSLDRRIATTKNAIRRLSVALELIPHGVELGEVEVGHLVNGIISAFFKESVNDRAVAFQFLIAVGILDSWWRGSPTYGIWRKKRRWALS